MTFIGPSSTNILTRSPLVYGQVRLVAGRISRAVHRIPVIGRRPAQPNMLLVSCETTTIKFCHLWYRLFVYMYNKLEMPDNKHKENV